MSDPVGDRLHDYYRTIQSDPPSGLESRVSRSFDTAAAARRPIGRWGAIAGFGAASAAVAALVIFTLVVTNLSPVTSPRPSDVTGPSGSPSPSIVANPSASASGLATPSGNPDVPSATPSYTPAPTPTPTRTPVPTPGHNSFVAAGPMKPWLSGPAVTLEDGRVLIAGGMYRRSDGMRLKTNVAELYDPATGKFTATGSMFDQRFGHTATLLKDGRVLVVGGADMSDGFGNLATAEIYSPSTGKFTKTGSMTQGRADHTATLMADGRVLIAGGFGGGTNSLASAEIYDPGTGKFTPTDPMSVTREFHTATLLPNGLVLIAGGLDDGASSASPGVVSSAELFDPGSGKFTATGSMPHPRARHAATILPDGTVLLAGGVGADQVTALKTADIYDPGTGKFTATGSMAVARRSPTATLLVEATVLIAGGDGVTTSEIYEPADGRFVGKHAMLGPVDSAALLGNGRVLLTGTTAQIYVP